MRLRQRARARGGPRLGAAPVTITVTVLTATRSRWTFSRPVLDSPALRSPDNYRTSPALTVHSVSVGPGATPSYVDLVTSEMVSGTSYTPFVERVEAA